MLPAATPVISPLAFTLATEALELDHSTPDSTTGCPVSLVVVAVACAVWPRVMDCTVSFTDTAIDGAFVVVVSAGGGAPALPETVSGADVERSPHVATSAVVPAARPTASGRPLGSNDAMVAIVVSEIDQRTWLAETVPPSAVKTLTYAVACSPSVADIDFGYTDA